ncbi:MAG: ATP-binding protein [Desulfobacterales bacterium]|nr:ATP-binding protein [Desulfobacterales bacterium]
MNNTFYENMIEGTTIPLMVVNGAGRIFFANKSSEVFTGYDINMLLQLNIRDLCAPYEQDRYIFFTLPKIRETTEVDIDLLRNDSQVFMASISFAPFQHEQTPYLLLTMQDVTAKRVQEGKTRAEEERYRRLLAERNVLQEQVNQSSKLACMGELAAGVAHEINNPLGIILGFVEDMLNETPEDHPLFETLKIIEQESCRCVGVVKDLLDFARQKPPERTCTDIRQLLEDSVSLLSPQIKKHKIRVMKTEEEELPCLEIDSHLIQQVFLNVMINAVQAMPDGGRLGLDINRVAERQQQDDQCLIRVTVTDTGHGIAAKEIDRIFDPFFSTKGSKGTGLGLSVCKRIMDDHFGRIAIENNKSGGITCSLFFPIHD